MQAEIARRGFRRPNIYKIAKENGGVQGTPPLQSEPPPWPCRPVKDLHVHAGGSLPLGITASNIRGPLKEGREACEPPREWGVPY